MKFYRMAIENIKTGKRDTYISKRQGAAPSGWRCIGVCGYYETPSKNDEQEDEKEEKLS